MAIRNYLWDPVNDCVLMETDESGNTIVEYTREPDGSLIGETREGTTFTHHYDADGSTTFLTDDSGAVTDTFEYDAWGNSVARTGTTPTPYQWRGREGYQLDTVGGALYKHERSYQPTIARWLSLGQRAVVIEINRYVAFNNAPIVDPQERERFRLTIDYDDNKQPHCPDQNGFWQWRFDVRGNWPCIFGWLVQKVTVYCVIEDCNGALKEADIFSYWEAWSVNNALVNVLDRASPPIVGCSHGEVTQLGELRFYCADDINVTEWAARQWFPNENSDCRTTSGDLIATGTEPDFWTNGTGRATPNNRSAFQSWTCCPKGEPCCGNGDNVARLSGTPGRGR